MGARGPKPKPTALKLAAGTRADRVNAKSPVVSSSLPEPPAFLAGLALAEWHRVASHLVAIKVLTPADSSALSLYCEAFALWRRAEEALAKDGHVVTNERDVTKANPWVAISSGARSEMLRLLSEFGLTPSARSRLSVPTEAKEDDLDVYLGKRKVT